MCPVMARAGVGVCVCTSVATKAICKMDSF